MRVHFVYLGAWFIRTKLHLEEFYDFIKYLKSKIGEEEKLKKLRANLKFKDIKYERALFDYITAKSNDFNTEYDQDGLLFLKKKTNEKALHKDMTSLKKYLENNLIAFLSVLYSKGAPVPKVFSNIESKRPVVLIASRANKKEIENIFKKYKDNIKAVEGTALKLYSGSWLNIIVDKDYSIKKEKFYTKLVKYIILFNDYKMDMEKFLNLHRRIWEDISKIRDRKRIKFKDLPKIRDSLLDTRKNISFGKTRLEQMNAFIKERKRVCDLIKFDSVLKRLDSYNFDELQNVQEYMIDLWHMTENYADTTIELINMLYQENEQSELNTLQIIFTIGVMASILALGAMPGAKMFQYGPTGKLITTTVVQSFTVIDFIKFGIIAFITGLIVYVFLHYIFKGAKSFKIIGLLKDVKKSSESIAHMFKE